MNKMLVATFNTETEAYKGLDALKDLHEKGDITLYAATVLVKDSSGTTSIKQAADEGPVGTALGMLAGGVIGLLGGPVGVAVGATAGGMTGLLSDLGNAGVDADFVDEVSEVLTPGRSAVLAEIDEDWVTPVDTKLGQLGASIFRRPRSEVIEDQLARESAALNAEEKELKEELKQSKAETKASVQEKLKSVQKKLKTKQDEAKEKLEQMNNEAKAKIKVLQDQMREAHDQRKAQIEKRISEVKANQKVRSEKLEKARKLAGEALHP